MIYEVQGLPDERNFNNSICEFEGKLLMAYRAEDQDKGIIPQIKICNLNGDFKPSTVTLINIPRPTPETNLFEDPRLFVHNGELWLSFVAALYAHNHHWACQGVAKLDKTFQPTRIFYPNVGDNQNIASIGGKLAREKNWTFFSLWGKLLFIYSINPLQIFSLDENTGEAFQQTNSRIKDGWKYGDIHGGTGFVESNGKLIGCFHSFTRDKVRNYHIGFYEISQPDALIRRISQEPWMSAKFDDSKDKRPLTQSWRPNVIFPCGMIKRGNEFWISYGWQDCRSIIVKVPDKEVWDNLKPVKEHFTKKKALSDPFKSIPGGFKGKIRGIPFHASNWLSCLTQTKSLGIKESELQEFFINKLGSDYTKEIWTKI